MNKYLVKIFLFFFIVTALDYSFGSICDFMVTYARGGANKQMRDLCMNDQYDVLIMGSSRACHHYDPQIIENSLDMNCYNAGYNGNGIILAYGIYSLIAERYKPKIIIYDLTLGFDYYEYLEDQHNKRYISLLKPYYKHEQIQDIVHRVSKEEYLKLFSGLLRFNCKTLTLLKDYFKVAPTKNNGYLPLSDKMKYEPSVHEEIPFYTPTDFTKKHFLESFIQKAKADSVTLVFAISPRYKSTSKPMYDEIKKVCKKYDVPILDFYNDINISSNKSLFKDVAHMNANGASIYTSMFCDALNDYLSLNK